MGDRVKSTAGISGYRKKSKEQLLKAIDECKSLSQLFALIQHEHITIHMQSQSGASNIRTRILEPNEIIESKDTPMERLRDRIRKAVEESR